VPYSEYSGSTLCQVPGTWYLESTSCTLRYHTELYSEYSGVLRVRHYARVLEYPSTTTESYITILPSCDRYKAVELTLLLSFLGIFKNITTQRTDSAFQ
jgi:hypothetical protein